MASAAYTSARSAVGRRTAVALVLGALIVAGATASAGADEPRGAEIAYRDGLLTVHASEVRLDALLEAIGREAGFDLIVHGDLPESVSWSIEAEPLLKALRLFAGRNGMVTIGADGEKRPRLVHVYPSERGSASTDATPRVDSPIETRGPEVDVPQLLQGMLADSDGEDEAALEALAEMSGQDTEEIAGRVAETKELILERLRDLSPDTGD